MPFDWKFDDRDVNWEALAHLYKVAPLGEKHPQDLCLVFGNSRYKCFVLQDGVIIGAGRALADGADCAYLCDVAVHPDFQGQGLGKAIIQKLVEFSAHHKKILLYAKPGTEALYSQLGFSKMNTAMAIFKHHDNAVASGLICAT